nr:MAG TPA: hypothetical protein [Caudoviricetes sp.]
MQPLKNFTTLLESPEAYNARVRAVHLERMAAREEKDKPRRHKLYTEAAELWEKAKALKQCADLMAYCERRKAYCLSTAALASK